MNKGLHTTEVRRVSRDTCFADRVNFVTCEICGAAIMRDPYEVMDSLDRHNAWHVKQSEAATRHMQTF